MMACLLLNYYIRLFFLFENITQSELCFAMQASFKFLFFMLNCYFNIAKVRKKRILHFNCILEINLPELI